MSSSPDLDQGALQAPSFALANQKRNADFHSLFRSVPEDDYLIEDYSAALQREIILAGRLYVSEGHICFSSNILGWVTSLVIAFDEIVAIEKENTAVVFPNAIAVQTLHARHVFRSLLGRDSTYDLITSIWHGSDPSPWIFSEGLQWDPDRFRREQDDSDSGSYGSEYIYDEDLDQNNESDGPGIKTAPASFDLEENESRSARQERRRERERPRRKSLVRSSSVPTDLARATSSQRSGQEKPLSASFASSNSAPAFPGPAQHPETHYDDHSDGYERAVKEDDVSAPLGQVYNLLFGSDSARFLEKLLIEREKNFDLHFDEKGSQGLTHENDSRTYTYTKPLNMPIGPKQTKCHLEEKLHLLDFERAIVITVSTHTPDIPSGNTFTVMTKYILTWALNNATHIKILCKVDWSGKSWLKGTIEKSSFDGQCTYGNDLVAALNAEITRQQFFPPSSMSKHGDEDEAETMRRKRIKQEESPPPPSQMPSSIPTSPGLRWGPFDPLRPYLEPLFRWSRQYLQGNTVMAVLVGIVIVLLIVQMTFVSELRRQAQPVYRHEAPYRAIEYEELWQREEDDLLKWLDGRLGISHSDDEQNDDLPPGSFQASRRHDRESKFPYFASGLDEEEYHRDAVSDRKGIYDYGSDVDDDSGRVFVNRFSSQFRDEKITDSEMQDLIQLTQERLETLRKAVEKRRLSRCQASHASQSQSTDTQFQDTQTAESRP